MNTTVRGKLSSYWALRNSQKFITSTLDYQNKKSMSCKLFIQLVAPSFFGPLISERCKCAGVTWSVVEHNGIGCHIEQIFLSVCGGIHTSI
jgi:hypothetical protein